MERRGDERRGERKTGELHFFDDHGNLFGFDGFFERYFLKEIGVWLEILWLVDSSFRRSLFGFDDNSDRFDVWYLLFVSFEDHLSDFW